MVYGLGEQPPQVARICALLCRHVCQAADLEAWFFVHAVLFAPPPPHTHSCSRATTGIRITNNPCLCGSVPIPFLDPYLKPGWADLTGLYAACPSAMCANAIDIITPFMHPDWPGENGACRRGVVPRLRKVDCYIVVALT